MRPKVVRVLAEEFENLKLGLILADMLVSILPRLCFSRIRTAIYRLAGVDIGPRTLVLGRVTITGPGQAHRRLHIGADCIINAPLFLDLTGEIRIGDRVSVAHHSVFVTAHHDPGPPEFRAGANCGRPIMVGDGAWIATGVTILPGVTVGRSAILASGAVVAQDVAEDVLAGGVPARVIRQLAGVAQS